MVQLKKKSAAKKTAAKPSTNGTAKKVRGTAPTDAEIKQVVNLRKAGKGWKDIMETMNKPVSFVHAVRPILREKHPGMVKDIGRASSNYGTGVKASGKTAPKAATSKKSAAKRSTSKGGGRSAKKSAAN